VLPAIRKHGAYALAESETMPLPADLADALEEHARTAWTLVTLVADEGRQNVSRVSRFRHRPAPWLKPLISNVNRWRLIDSGLSLDGRTPARALRRVPPSGTPSPSSGARRIVRVLRLALSLAVLITPLPAAAAFQNCDKPVPPICVLGADPFPAIGDDNICRRAVMAYCSRMKGFEACMQADLDDARKEFQDAIDSFGKRRVKVDD
jgi:hypothetical protein